MKAENRRLGFENRALRFERNREIYAGNELVSLILLNRNGLEHLKTLFCSLKNSAFYNNIEFIIVDNASSDASLQYLRQHENDFSIHVIENSENETFSKANNQAAGIARGSLLLFLNNDTEVTDHWLDEMLFAMKTVENPGAIGAKLVYPKFDDPKQAKYSYTIQHRGIAFKPVVREEMDFMQPYNMGKHMEDMDFGTEPIERGAVTAAALLVSKEAFEKVGGFDEHYVYGYEDVDLCLKLYQAGYRNYYCPTAQLYHYEFGTQNKDVPEEVKTRRHNNFLWFREKWQDFLEAQLKKEENEGKHLFFEDNQ